MTIESESALQKAVDDFHAHLDERSWCDNHPFALCQQGRELSERVLQWKAEKLLRPERKS